uniref:Putative capsid protein n=1 Tax=viral metagenome TaxID=1070528 RepID=A0A6H1ZWS3_9ZZZZ
MAQTLSEVADTHWAAVGRTIDDEVIDNIFEKYATVDAFRTDALQITDSGGRGFEVHIETGTNTQAGSFDKYDPLNKDPVNPVESAFYNKRYYYCPIILSDTEYWENSGPEKRFDELRFLGENSMKSLIKTINEDFYSAQTGKNMLGFQDIIADAASSTLGGISASTTASWDNNRYTTSKTFLTQTTTNIFDGFVAWNALLDAIHIDGGRPKKLFTTWSVVRAYRTAVSGEGYARTDLANAKGVGGKMAPSFYDMDVVPDNDCTALHCYMVDPDGLKLRVMKQVNFKKTPFVPLQSNGQLAQLAYVVAGVQLVCSARRYQGVATAVTGS